MNRTKKLLTLLCATLVGASTTARLQAQILPVPEENTVIAGWGGSKTFWTNPFTAPVSGISSVGTFTVSSNFGPAGRWNGFLPSMLSTAGGAPLTLNVSNFSGEFPATLTLELASFKAPTAGMLTIGTESFSLSQATAATSFEGTFGTSGWNNARYADTNSVAPPTLFSYTWDLEALNFQGTDFSSFTIGLTMPAQFSLYDVQLSTTTSAVPEPSTYGMIISAALAGFILMRRRNQRIEQGLLAR